MVLQNRITSAEDDGASSWVPAWPGGRGQQAAIRALGMPTELTDPSIRSHTYSQELLLLPPKGPGGVVRMGNRP